jgi:phospholipid/cholesterol/gamma-HCH transport system substrate-binding protein
MARRVRLAEAVLAVIVVLGALLVANSILTGGGLFGSSYHVKVLLANAGGLHDRSDVTYRGQYIGTVTDVHLTQQGVVADLSLNSSVQVPVNSEIVVADLSAVGEQYLDIRPRTASGPFLKDNSVISQAVVTPLPAWQVFANVQRLLSQISPADLSSISREVGAIFGPGDVNLRAFAHEVDTTFTWVNKLSPTYFSLLEQAKTPLSTLAALSPDFRTFALNARSLAIALKASDAALARLIDQGAVVLPMVTDLVKQTTPVVVRLMADGTPLAVMAARHLPGLQHWYEFTPAQLKAMAMATRDGSAWTVLVLTPANNCLYGPTVSPYQRNVTLPTSAQCTTRDPHLQQRGSQYVPYQ